MNARAAPPTGEDPAAALAAARATLFDVASTSDEQEMQVAIYVYEAPLRAWHWLNATAILLLCVTGWFIGTPPFSIAGEPSDTYLMGYVRFAHFAAGLSLAIGFLGRAIYAVFGNAYSRELFTLPVHSRQYWSDLRLVVAWYCFASPTTKRVVGHNALARFGMFFLFLLPCLFMIVTGLSLYAEGLGMGHPLYRLAERVLPALGGSLQVHALHRTGMWILVCFVMIHVYVAIREELIGPQSMISTMISGWRMFK